MSADEPVKYPVKSTTPIDAHVRAGGEAFEVTITGHMGQEVTLAVFVGVDDTLVVQVDTQADGYPIRINLNDAPVFDGDPEVGDDEPEPEPESTYSVWCYYQDASCAKTFLEGGLTLEQAKEICNDPDTSSRTTTTTEGKQRTARFGAWFYGYTED